MSPGFNHCLQCMKNDRLGVSVLPPLVLCCLRRRDVWPWEEVTVFQPTVAGTESELPIAHMKELSGEVKGVSTPLPPLRFSLLLLFSLGISLCIYFSGFAF